MDLRDEATAADCYLNFPCGPLGLGLDRRIHFEVLPYEKPWTARWGLSFYLLK